MLRILSLKDSEEVNKIINDMLEKDVHASPGYMKLFVDYLGWEALYVHYEDYGGVVLVPFFKRKINDTDYFDLVGPWYFGGPLVNVTSKETFKGFLKGLSEWCKENNIVSEFQRFNPLLKNQELYP